MLRRLVLLFIVGMSVLWPGCRAEDRSPIPAAIPDSTYIPYDFRTPDAGFALPRALVEISGLAARDTTGLLAVQDEEGLVFHLNRETAEVERVDRFASDGDYEGVAVVGDSIWVLRSDGRLFWTAQASTETRDGAELDSTLHPDCDAEGLAHDARHGRLLIACKEQAGPGLGDVRAIYSFDPVTRSRGGDPAILIELALLGPAGRRFKPSALAFHPQSGLLYVLSSVERMLVALDPDSGRLLEKRALPADLFPQPEGLAVFPDGTLFISSEGAGGPGTLFRFDPTGTMP